MGRSTEARHQLREICRAAARIFYEKGYDGASMQDIAAAVGLTKAGLYHHVGSKERLLFETMNYGMDILDETVLHKVKDIADPAEKLRQTIAGHVNLIVQARDFELTVILHENRSLKGTLQERINVRKKEYIHFLEGLIAETQQSSGRKPLVSAHLAAFFLLGSINWLYQWYHPEGSVNQDDLTLALIDFFFRGLLNTE
jgi:TetR/AcrR family transcriptional regulator, cholesterol catabolism regulator